MSKLSPSAFIDFLRGKGLGKALFAALMKTCIELKVGYLTLTATKLGAPVYKKFGFKELADHNVFLDLYYSVLSTKSY